MFVHLYRREPGFDVPYVPYDDLHLALCVEDTDTFFRLRDGNIFSTPMTRSSMSSNGNNVFKTHRRASSMTSSKYNKIFKKCSRAARRKRGDKNGRSSRTKSVYRGSTDEEVESGHIAIGTTNVGGTQTEVQSAARYFDHKLGDSIESQSQRSGRAARFNHVVSDRSCSSTTNGADVVSGAHSSPPSSSRIPKYSSSSVCSVRESESRISQENKHKKWDVNVRHRGKKVIEKIEESHSSSCKISSISGDSVVASSVEGKEKCKKCVAVFKRRALSSVSVISDSDSSPMLESSYGTEDDRSSKEQLVPSKMEHENKPTMENNLERASLMLQLEISKAAVVNAYGYEEAEIGKEHDSLRHTTSDNGKKKGKKRIKKDECNVVPPPQVKVGEWICSPNPNTDRVEHGNEWYEPMCFFFSRRIVAPTGSAIGAISFSTPVISTTSNDATT